MATMTWKELISELASSIGVTELSKRSGASRAAIYKWISGSPPAADAVIDFARKIGESPTRLLVASGHLSADEASGLGAADLHSASIDALLDELRRRTEE